MPNDMTSDKTSSCKSALLERISFAQCKYCNKLIAIEVLSEHFDQDCRSSVDQREDESIDIRIDKKPTCEQSFKLYISEEFKVLFFGGQPKNNIKQSAKTLYIRLLKMYLEKSKYEYVYKYGEQHLKKYEKSLSVNKYF